LPFFTSLLTPKQVRPTVAGRLLPSRCDQDTNFSHNYSFALHTRRDGKSPPRATMSLFGGPSGAGNVSQPPDSTPKPLGNVLDPLNDDKNSKKRKITIESPPAKRVRYEFVRSDIETFSLTTPIGTTFRTLSSS